MRTGARINRKHKMNSAPTKSGNETDTLCSGMGLLRRSPLPVVVYECRSTRKAPTYTQGAGVFNYS